MTVIDRSSKWRVLRVASEAPAASAMPPIMLSRSSSIWPKRRRSAGMTAVIRAAVLSNGAIQLPIFPS